MGSEASLAEIYGKRGTAEYGTEPHRKYPHRRVCTVDDGRQRQHSALGIQNDWVHHRALNDGHKLPQLEIVLCIVLQQATELSHWCRHETGKGKDLQHQMLTQTVNAMMQGTLHVA